MLKPNFVFEAFTFGATNGSIKYQLVGGLYDDSLAPPFAPTTPRPQRPQFAPRAPPPLRPPRTPRPPTRDPLAPRPQSQLSGELHAEKRLWQTRQLVVVEQPVTRGYGDEEIRIS